MEGSFTGDSKGFAKQGSRYGRLFPYVPHFWDTWWDAPFLGPFIEGKNFYLGKFLGEIWEIGKNDLLNGQLSP